MMDISGETKLKEVTIHDPASVIPEDLKKHLEKVIKIAFEK